MKEITLKLDRYEAQNLLTNIKFFIEYFEEDCNNNNWEAMYVTTTNRELYEKIKKQLEEQRNGTNWNRRNGTTTRRRKGIEKWKLF